MRDVQNINTQIIPRVDLLVHKDDAFFETPFLIYNVDISDIFRKASKKNKDVFWKYLQSLFLLSSSINKHVDDIDESINIILKEFNDILNDDTECSDNFDTENLDEMYGSFLKGTQLGKLAEDISKKMDMDKLVQELNIDQFNQEENKRSMKPPNIHDIMKLLSGKNGNLMNMVQTVSEEIHSKMESGELNQDIMMREVQDMMKKVTNDPAFKTVIQSKEIKNMMQSPNLKNMFNDLNNRSNGVDDDFQVLENMFQHTKHNKEGAQEKTHSTRDRLRAKLEDRKKKQLKD